MEKNPTRRGGFSVWRIQLSEDPTLGRVWLSEDPTWRRIWLLEEDLALREGSGAQRIQFLEDPVLEGSNSRRRIQLLEEDWALGGCSFRRYNSWRTWLSENPTLGAPGSWRRIQCSPHRCCPSRLAGVTRVLGPGEPPVPAPLSAAALGPGPRGLQAVPCSSPAVPPGSGLSRQHPPPAPLGSAPVPPARPAPRG